MIPLLLLPAVLAQEPPAATGLRGEARYLLVASAPTVLLAVRCLQVSPAYTDALVVLAWGRDGRRVLRETVPPGGSGAFPLRGEDSPFTVLCRAGRNAIEASCEGARLVVDARLAGELKLYGQAGPLYFATTPADRMAFTIHAEEPAEISFLAPDGTEVWHRAIPDHTEAEAVLDVKPGWREGNWQLRARLDGDVRIVLDSAVVPLFAAEAVAADALVTARDMVDLDGTVVDQGLLTADKREAPAARLRTADGLSLDLGADGGLLALGADPGEAREPWPRGCFALTDHTAAGGLQFATGRVQPGEDGRRARLELRFDGSPFSLSAQAEAAEDHIAITGTLRNSADDDRAVTLLCLLPVPGAETWWDDVDTSREPRPGRPMGMGKWQQSRAGAQGHVSQYPLGCVTGGAALGGSGVALAVPLTRPVVHRIGYVEAAGLLYLALDFGLTPDTAKFPNRADFALVLYRTDAAWGFRDALRRYYELFPEDFEVRVPRMGGWVCWGDLADTPEPGDFGFQYHWGPSGAAAVAHDEELGVYSFVYDDSVRYFADLGVFEQRPTAEQATAVFNELLASEDPRGLLLSRDPKATGRQRYASRERSMGREAAEQWLKDSLEAARRSACVGADGAYHVGYIINREDWGPENWWTGRLFCNPDPDLPGGYGTFLFDRILEPSFQQLGAQGGRLDGVGLDNYFVYANLLDFRREHFAFVDHPLSFDTETLRPAAVGDFLLYEWVEELSRRMHERGCWLIANQGVWPYPFAARVLDIHGFEWGIERAAPVARALAYHKPVVSLPVADEHYQEPFIRAHVRFGFLPGGYAGKAFAEREGVRELYRRYMPALLACARAGWEPVTHARSSNQAVKVERFGRVGGDMLLSLVNQSQEPQQALVRIEAGALSLEGAARSTRGLLSDGEVAWKPEGPELVGEVALAPGEADVIRF